MTQYALRKYAHGGRSMLRKSKSIFIKPPQQHTQLEMVWPEERLSSPPSLLLPPGFNLRTYRPGDEDNFFKLIDGVGMGPCPLDYWFLRMLPEGFFFIDDEATGRAVATCMASHHPVPRHPFGGNFGWLAVDPNCRGLGLGHTVSAAVTRRLIEVGYTRIYLETDDHRLPAIKIYLRMGWVPFLFEEDMLARWQVVCEQLGWEFSPQDWQSTIASPPSDERGT